MICGHADSVRGQDDENEDEASEQEYCLSPEEVTVENERRTIVQRCLDILPELDRKILTIMYFNECPRTKIAQDLGLSENYIKWKLETARRLMKNYLTDWMDVSDIWNL
jgi:RNA polymerase sigma factor (sigma-70 family)